GEEFDNIAIGGFFARWKMVLVPYDASLLGRITSVSNDVQAQEIIKDLVKDTHAVEVQIPGPFLETGCEWGDSDEIDVQHLTYNNYPVYDWDFFPGVTRVIGVVYEGDERVGDDLIAVVDISQNSGTVTLSETGRYELVFVSQTNVLQ